MLDDAASFFSLQELLQALLLINLLRTQNGCFDIHSGTCRIAFHVILHHHYSIIFFLE